MAGFNSQTQDVQVHSPVAITLNWALPISNVSTTVTVQGDAGDLLENDSTFHTDLDRKLIDKIPLESSSSSVSSLVTLASPGVAADSNGLFHGLGDHAENSFSVDGQPITDQQSKVFSNQIPLDSVQSIEVIAGAPPAEYGDKTSLVIDVTTRSGLGVGTPTGNITAAYGTFGTTNVGANLAYGTQRWGNFISLNGSNSGRFLDGPSSPSCTTKGNEENFFDRVDYQINSEDSLHTNFELHPLLVPNAELLRQPEPRRRQLTGVPVDGPADQRSQIKTIDVSPSWTHLINASSSFPPEPTFATTPTTTIPAPIPSPTSAPPNLQQETVGQQRSLTNVGAHAEFTYSHGIHNIKAGSNYSQTVLNEAFQIGIVNPNYLPSTRLLRQRSRHRPALHLPAPLRPHPRRHRLPFTGHTDVKELALYMEDSITTGNWAFNLGIRGDLYNGLTMPPGRTPPRSSLQNQAHQHHPPRLLRPHAGDSLQRKPHPLQRRLPTPSSTRSCSALHPACKPHRSTRLPQRVSRRIPAGLRPLPRLSAASTSANTPTTPTTSASSAPRPSPSPSSGTTPKSPATRPPQRAQHPRLLRPRRHVQRRCPLLHPANSAASALLPAAVGFSLPHRPRREIQPDHSLPISAHPKGLTWPSTGAMTAASSPAPLPATTPSFSTDCGTAQRRATKLDGQRHQPRASPPTSNSRPASPAAASTPPSDPLPAVCPASQFTLQADPHPRTQHRE